MLESRKYAPEVLEAEAAPEQATSSVKHKTLKELTLALLKEVESLKGNESPDGRLSVNFAEEVRRFETDLIRWALLRTGGHQRRAARMLNLKVTTLNAKIKRYGIRPNAVSVSNVVDMYPDPREQ